MGDDAEAPATVLGGSVGFWLVLVAVLGVQDGSEDIGLFRIGVICVYLGAVQRFEYLSALDPGHRRLPVLDRYEDALEPGLVVFPPQLVVPAPVGLAALREQRRRVTDDLLMVRLSLSESVALALGGGQLAGQFLLLLAGYVVRDGAGHGLLGPEAALPLDGLDPLVESVPGVVGRGGVVGQVSQQVVSDDRCLGSGEALRLPLADDLVLDLLGG